MARSIYRKGKHARKAKPPEGADKRIFNVGYAVGSKSASGYWGNENQLKAITDFAAGFVQAYLAYYSFKYDRVAECLGVSKYVVKKTANGGHVPRGANKKLILRDLQGNLIKDYEHE